MNDVMILIGMIWLHIFADYHLQGILCFMKQMEWWKKQPGYSEKYRRDYRSALFAHAFEWAFIVMIPMLWSVINGGTWHDGRMYVFLLIANYITHAYVDDAKANEGRITLRKDQAIHLSQILATWVIWVTFSSGFRI